jgi:hypothetical protein
MIGRFSCKQNGLVRLQQDGGEQKNIRWVRLCISEIHGGIIMYAQLLIVGEVQ